MQSIHQIVEQTFREQSGRVMASLINYLNDFDLAEDAMQDAFITALERWQTDGVPRNPAAWITTTARRKAIDRIRRMNALEQKTDLLKQDMKGYHSDDFTYIEGDEIPDERLKLIFTCCHPALTLQSQVALTLKTLGGLNTQEIANAFLVPTKTMAQRLVRAKRKIKEAHIPYRVPPKHLISERIQPVLSVIYLIFNEGYDATSGDVLIRRDLCAEAIRLGRILVKLLEEDESLDEDAEALGLLALMLFADARRDARTDDHGAVILLADQDRSLWDREQIAEGTASLRHALQLSVRASFVIQAEIAACHALAPDWETTDWQHIIRLYGELLVILPSPIVKLNRAIAIALGAEPEEGLALIKQSNIDGELADYYLYHASVGDLNRRIGNFEEAQLAFQKAIEICQNEVARNYLQQRLDEVTFNLHNP